MLPHLEGPIKGQITRRRKKPSTRHESNPQSLYYKHVLFRCAATASLKFSDCLFFTLFQTPLMKKCQNLKIPLVKNSLACAFIMILQTNSNF